MPSVSFPGLDVGHFARLTVLKDDALAAQPQPTIIHGALHLLIHVVELQCFCHADLALMVPRELLGGCADAGPAGDLLGPEPRGHRRPGGGRARAGGTARAGAPFRSLTKTFQPTIAGNTIGSMLFEAHHREEK